MAKAKIAKLSTADQAEMGKRIKPIFQNWVGEMKARGLKGEEGLDALHAILQELGVKEPFFK